jgi:hypothetical protein
MVMPSLLTWVIGAAVVVALSVVLRAVANDAQRLARSRAEFQSPLNLQTATPPGRQRSRAGRLDVTDSYILVISYGRASICRAERHEEDLP